MKNYLYKVFIAAVFLFTCKNPGEKEITFSAHIAPLIHENCTPCHRPNAAGPFSLITYDDVVKKAKTIVKVTQSGFMPPWPADPAYSNFIGERILDASEKEMIAQWVVAGCPIGDSTKIPMPPSYPAGSQIGVPDMVVKFPETIPLPGTNKDQFFLLKIPFEADHTMYIRTIEFIPGNKKLLHHVNANLIQYTEGQKSDLFAGEKVIPTDLTLTAEELNTRMQNKNDDGTYPVMIPLVCNYLPGVSPAIYPKGIGGYRLTTQNAFFINDVHYGPSPVDTVDDGSYFNIFLTDEPPLRPTYEILMGSLGETQIEPPLVIPAGEIKSFKTVYNVQADMSLLTVNPHMHLLGKSFLAYAVTPQNDTIKLVRIPKWDFRWQYFYTFKKIQKIPAGSRIVAEAVFDNTADNPNNPFNPPQVIIERNSPFESMKTTNEMFQLIFTYMPYRPGDENISLENVKID